MATRRMTNEVDLKTRAAAMTRISSTRSSRMLLLGILFLLLMHTKTAVSFSTTTTNGRNNILAQRLSSSSLQYMQRIMTTVSTNQHSNNRPSPQFNLLHMSAVPEEDEKIETETEIVKKNSGLKRLAELSLQDYQWRSNIWKSKQADAELEKSLNRMMGREEETSYLRPMDASALGPLGLWEKTSVEWLEDVIEEEARRAQEIVRLGGTLVRPMDSCNGSSGPLGQLERRIVTFFQAIRQSETERSKSGICVRPKDMEASKRGPLGEAELRAVQAIRQVIQSEQVRAQRQNSNPDKSIVRPIDVPGPLGDFEMAILNVVKAEEMRAQEYQAQLQLEECCAVESDQGPIRTNCTDPNPITKMRPIRPMNANNPGPLGELEQQATDFVKRLTQEEKQRLQNIQQYLDDNRPMNLKESSKDPLGIIETVVVGIVRAPILMWQIVKRVQTLLESEPLDDADAEILRNKIEERRSGGSSKDGIR